MRYLTLPDPTDFCPGCARARCACPHPAHEDARHAAAYAAGHAAGLEGGYDDRPMTEWVYRTGHRVLYRPGPDGRPRLVYAMTPIRFAAFSWRRFNRTGGAYRRWFEREYGHDLRAYLAGFDDAGAGLPSAVDDPECHAVSASALDAYGPEPLLYEWPAAPAPAWTEGDDGLPF